MSNTVYLTRHGQSINNLKDIIGGNCNLSNRGVTYSKSLYDYIKEEEDFDSLKIYTSNLKRTIETAKHFPNKNKNNMSILNEINAGIFEQETFSNLKNRYPDEFKKRNSNKFNYRYPDGESYKDLKKRVLGIIKNIHQDFYNNNNCLIICHNAVLKILYGFFKNIPDNEIPFIEVPLHTIFKFEHENNDYKLTIINLN